MAHSQVSFESFKRPAAAARPSHDPNPNHHLWRNGRLWWVAFTVHLPGWQKERVRLSLGTADVVEARHLRDELLKSYPETRACELSLRLAPPRKPERRIRRSEPQRQYAA